MAVGEQGVTSPVHYFTTTFPAEDGEYGPGTWYAEFSDGVPLRQFEVYALRVLVAPYDFRFADQYDAILSDPHYHEISSGEFEVAWNRFAAARLKEPASQRTARETSSSTMNVEMMTFSKPSGIPHELAAPLLERGVPKEMLGRYQAASVLKLVETPRRGQLVWFGIVMGSDCACLDPHTGAVIEIIDGPPGDEWLEWPINSSLEQFIASVGAVLNRYPFANPQAKDESDDRYLDRRRAELDQAVEDLKVALSAIDPAAMDDPNGFWMTFLDDVYMGDFSISAS